MNPKGAPPPSLDEVPQPQQPAANAGSQIFTAHYQPPALTPWGGFGVFCLYVLAALVAAVVLTDRRDAAVS